MHPYLVTHFSGFAAFLLPPAFLVFPACGCVGLCPTPIGGGASTVGCVLQSFCCADGLPTSLFDSTSQRRGVLRLALHFRDCQFRGIRPRRSRSMLRPGFDVDLHSCLPARFFRGRPVSIEAVVAFFLLLLAFSVACGRWGGCVDPSCMLGRACSISPRPLATPPALVGSRFLLWRLALAPCG